MLHLIRRAPRAARGRGFRVHRAEPGFLATTEAFGPLAETAKPLTYYSAWFCPFAHRATLALEHHADVVPYAWEEALGWEQRPSDAASLNPAATPSARRRRCDCICSTAPSLTHDSRTSCHRRRVAKDRELASRRTCARAGRRATRTWMRTTARTSGTTTSPRGCSRRTRWAWSCVEINQ